jgi:serine/threonine protein kinase/tetratricopeptide (TPR) repeat protein
MDKITLEKDMIGKLISHYRILEQLGKGGMGEVYLAEDLKLERKVAIKFLPQHLTKDKENVERFEREAKATATLNHPNIVTIYEIAEENTQVFIVMESIDGQSLRTKIKSGFLDLYEILDITNQICDGLSEAHKADIVHRDIKPENILIDKNGRVKILDFGLAKLKGVSKLTKETSTLGTLHYMSPEQIQGQEIDHRSDIWSLGVVLYEMLTGIVPFTGDYEQAIMYTIINQEPDFESDRSKQIFRPLKAVVQKILKKNPDERYQSIATIHADLMKMKSEIDRQPRAKTESEKEDKPSLAVLPFVNMSTDPENEYFSDGLTEELINALTGLKDFRVVARTSAFAFKGKQVDIRNVGAQLGVQKVLEGSVRKSGNRIRITAQLINVEDGYHLWSEKYDRDLEDVFAIQDEIASEIAGKLKSEFIMTSSLLDKKKQPDLEAYELYLKGRYHFNKFSSEWAKKALECFQEAVSIAPEFAPAHAALARTYIFLTNPFGTLDNQTAMPKAKSAAEKALEIDADLSEAYVSMGSIATFHEWDSAKAHHFFKKAIALNANDVNARMWYELALSLLDQDFDEALAQMKIALELDPLNILILVRTGYVYLYKYDFDTALTYYNKIIQIEPALAGGYHGLQDIYGIQGKYDLAIEAGEKAAKLGNNEPAFIADLALYCGRSGNTTRANEILNSLLDRSRKEPISPFWIAVVYLGLGQMDKMFEMFDKALEKHDSNLLYLFAPPFDPIRDDPRFITLRNKMGIIS